jgi:hypothetical protein
MPAKTVIQLRQGTAAQWTSANPVLATGEPGFETDTNKFKLGDGTTAWASLAYQGAAYVLSTAVGAANGVASLDSSGLIPQAQIPAVAITSTYVVASQVAMLALTAQEGDVAVRTDLNKTYILVASPASTLANWQEILAPSGGGGGVTSITATSPLTGGTITTSGSIGIDQSLLTVAESQVTNLVTDLAAKAPTANATFTGNTTIANMLLDNHFQVQAAPTAKSAAATLTIAELLTEIIDFTGSASNLTLPTGTLTDAGVLGGALPVGYAFEWSVISRGTGTPTIVAGTAHTLVGSGAVTAAQASGIFRTKKTATNTFITYRVG